MPENISTDYTSSRVGRPTVSTNDKDKNSVNIDDFLQLMVSQLQNQDFMNPVDDTQYLTQMAQFATMQQMQELAAYSKTSYAMSLAGKNVTVASVDSIGNVNSVTGNVQKVSLVNNEYKIFVDGTGYTLDQVMEINGPAVEESTKVDTTNKAVQALVDKNSAEIWWPAASTHPDVKGTVKYSVYYSTNDEFDTYEQVTQNGTLIGEADRKELTSESLKGLQSNTKYYVNVVVTDQDGNRHIYKKAAFQTQ